jgi:dipeptidyl aminopeptidase/acylaminoacyl peptidase
MRISRCSLPSLLALMLSTALAVERLPVEDFARAPDVTRARLSPDGKHLAYLAEVSGRTKLHVAEPGTNVVVRLDIGGAPLMNNAPKEVASFGWVSNDRLIITTTAWDAIYGVMAVNRDGEHEVAISGYEGLKASLGYTESFFDTRLFAYEVIHSFYDKDQTVLMLDRHERGGGRGPNRPDVIAINTDNGRSSTVVENPGEVSIWGVDNHGVTRLGLLSHGDLKGAIYRESDSAPWRTILPLQDRKGQMRPVGFDGAQNKIYVADLTEQKRWTIFPLDPATGEKGAPLLTDPEYDILPDHFTPSMDGLPLATAIFSRKSDALIGIRFVTDAPRVKWFDRDYAVYQQAVDKALPNTVNLLVDSSEDEKRLLWFGFSDQSPGTYYLMDLEKHTFKPVAPRMSWIKPAQMAPMLAINYKARDGLLVHGFLTVPVGHKPQGLPLVVMPHGGPWARDVWGFDPLVQLLASRGYAVLQMNYRGSPGYGEQLYDEARRQIGGKIQDDIEDATRWAIAAGVAEPKRIAIYGASYGGYSALFALGHNPELYRCGISYAGVTDWPAMFADSDVAENKAAKKYWREQIGDLALDKDKDRLRSVSPVNFADKIAAPVLIIQGKDDRRVPQDQATRMIAALERAGRKPESRFIAGVGHTCGREKDRIETFKTIVDFLKKQLGPGVE